MSHDRNQKRHRCGLCKRILRPDDSLSVAGVGHRCYRCFNDETADQLGVAFDNTAIAPFAITDVDGVRHRFEIRSMLVATGHAMQAREVGKPGARGGYRFEILGDLEADAHDLFRRLRDRIRQALSVRHVEETENGWQLTRPHRLNGVIEWDPDGDLPLLIVDGRPFTWDQIGRMLIAFEGFTLNAAVQDTTEVIGGPLAAGQDERRTSDRQLSSETPAAHRLRSPNRRTATRTRPTRAWPPSPSRLDALIEEATVDAYGDAEQATAFLTVLDEHLAVPCEASVLGEVVAVEKIDLGDAGELIAMCRRRGKRHKVRLSELELTAPRPKGAEWVAAYRRWYRR